MFADVLELMVRYTVWQLLDDFNVEESLCHIQGIVCNVSIATVIGMTIRYLVRKLQTRRLIDKQRQTDRFQRQISDRFQIGRRTDRRTDKQR